jgi:hypothetical protein
LWRVTRAAHHRRHHPGDRSDPAAGALAAALGCLLVHTYYTLGIAVHENHLFLALPLGLLASVVLPEYRKVALVIGLTQAFNLFAFYGVSGGIGWLPPRQITVVDVTVPLALAAVVGWGWHVAIFTRLTRPAAAGGPTAPA